MSKPTLIICAGTGWSATRSLMFSLEGYNHGLCKEDHILYGLSLKSNKSKYDHFINHFETIDRQKISDWHNPILFNIILKNFLNIVGYNPDLSRYLPFIFGALSFIVISQISYQEKKDESFIFTTFLVCTSIYIIKYSQELRPYSLLLLTSSLNIFFYLKQLKETEQKNGSMLFFIIFSILNYSVNPFALIIFFS